MPIHSHRVKSQKVMICELNHTLCTYVLDHELCPPRRIWTFRGSRSLPEQFYDLSRSSLQAGVLAYVVFEDCYPTVIPADALNDLGHGPLAGHGVEVGASRTEYRLFWAGLPTCM
ncbi:hypothetical protein K474DRAFT_1259076 [Panus rudis PR-1116 ss-1]|nr:hypothetical protein K474DRAFT_1259076 [Panus rudis PR-1116 ss-1]